MAKNKKIAVAIIAGVLTVSLGIGTALAASTAGPQPTSKTKAALTQQEKEKQNDAYTHEELVETANKVGIDISGKTDEQIMLALREFKLQQASKQDAGAPSPGEPKPIGLSGDTKTANPPTHEDLVKLASELGIDISGMTDDQIMLALREYKLQQASKQAAGALSREELEKKAQEVGVDPTGLSDDDLSKAIKQAMAEMDPKTTIPLTHEDLIKIAADIGIDITGMSDTQIEDALRAEKASHDR